VLSVVADVAGVDVDELRSASRAKLASRPRSLAAYLLRADAGMTAAQVAPILGRSRETIFYLSRCVSTNLAQDATMGALVERIRNSPGYRPTQPQPLNRAPRLLPDLSFWSVVAGLTQAELARRAGVARQTVVALEGQRRPASLETIRRLAAALLVAPSMLTGNDDLDGLVDEDFRRCKGCGALRPQHAFTPAKGTPYVYLRCRICRAARAKAQYHSDPRVRAAVIERAARNGRLRRTRANLRPSPVGERVGSMRNAGCTERSPPPPAFGRGRLSHPILQEIVF